MIGTTLLGLMCMRWLPRIADRALLSVWLGTLAIATALTAASLVAPIGSAISLAVVITLFGAALLPPQTRASISEIRRALHIWPVVGLTALMFGIGFYSSSQPVSFADTGLYHAAAIEWLSRYGAIRGIAFLEYRYAFASSWFSLTAAFNWSFLRGHMETLAGGYVLLLASAHLVLSAARLARQHGQVADWFATIAYLVAITWFIRVGIPISPSPDLPVIVLVILVTWVLLLRRDGATIVPVASRLLTPSVLPVVLAAGAVAIKLSAVPLLVVAALFCALRVKSPRHLLAITTLAALIVLPTIVVSFTVSGCPLFPSPILCVHEPWSLGSAAAAHDQIESRDFLRWTGTVPSHASSWNWIPHWSRSEPLGTIAIAFGLGAVMGFFVFIRTVASTVATWIVLVGGVGLIFVLTLAPTYRFLIGYAVVPAAYLGASLCDRWKIHPLIIMPSTVVAIASIESVTLTDYHSNELTSSARWSTLIIPVGALSVWIAKLIGGSPYRWTLWTVPPHVDIAIAGSLVGLILGTSSLGLVPNSRPLPRPGSASDYMNALISPPGLPRALLMKHRLNDVDYVSPADGQCWANTPCSSELVPAGIHLLNPKHGIAGGLGE